MQGRVATLLRGSRWGLDIPEQPTRQGCGGRAQFSDCKLCCDAGVQAAALVRAPGAFGVLLRRPAGQECGARVAVGFGKFPANVFLGCKASCCSWGRARGSGTFLSKL